jgi:hypothetical protein
MGGYMAVLPEDKIIVSLLPPEDARQVLLALFSEGEYLPEMTPLANMAYVVITGKGYRISKANPGTGNKVRAPKGNRDAVKHMGTDDADHIGEMVTVELQERRFAEFWALYPRKVGKEAARKAWRSINPTTALHAKILTTIKTAKNCGQWQRDNGRYIPNPATWLNQGRWDDEIQTDTPRRLNRNSSNMGNFTQREYDDEFFEQFVTSDFSVKT